MLETAGDEKHDWEDAGEEFAWEGFRGKGHIDGETDKDIAEEAKNDAFLWGEGAFGTRNTSQSGADETAIHTVGAGDVTEESEQ